MAYDDRVSPTILEERLKADLRRALRSRDRTAVVALRTAIAAIDNAGSANIPQGGDTLISGKSEDVPRRELTEREAVELLRGEVDELGAGISAAEQHGDEERARELRARRDVIAAYV